MLWQTLDSDGIYLDAYICNERLSANPEIASFQLTRFEICPVLVCWRPYNADQMYYAAQSEGLVFEGATRLSQQQVVTTKVRKNC